LVAQHIAIISKIPQMPKKIHLKHPWTAAQQWNICDSGFVYLILAILLLNAVEHRLAKIKIFKKNP
jgi:hypothetical protein